MKYCSNPAGKGTDHKGSGRCYLHGGCGGAEKTPAGIVKCAQVNLTHGRYSKVFRNYLLSRKGEDAEKILELLQSEEGLDAIIDTTISSLLIDYFTTGNVRAADLALKYLKEALKTKRSRAETGIEEGEDPAERIVRKLELKVEVRERVPDKSTES